MEKTLSSQASDWREGRRLRALELKERGWKQTEIADALGITEGAVSQWMKRAREEGVEGLKHKPPPGATPRLNEQERARLRELLARGAEAHGFRGEAWTCERVAKVIRKEFEVSYHPALTSVVWFGLFGTFSAKARSSGRPARRPGGHRTLRKAQTWPKLKRGPCEGGQDHRVRGPVGLLCVGDVGSHLRSSRPETPVLREHLTREHLSAMSGITLDWRASST
jgi:transposase